MNPLFVRSRLRSARFKFSFGINGLQLEVEDFGGPPKVSSQDLAPHLPSVPLGGQRASQPEFFISMRRRLVRVMRRGCSPARLSGTFGSAGATRDEAAGMRSASRLAQAATAAKTQGASPHGQPLCPGKRTSITQRRGGHNLDLRPRRHLILREPDVIPSPRAANRGLRGEK